jgi:molybdate transport system substrate-binding protein
MRRLIISSICAALMVPTSIGVSATEIKLIAANALKEALVELLPGFEKSSGIQVKAIWAGTTAIAKRIRDGEAIDVVVIGSEEIDKLIADGKLASGSRTDFARSGVGIAVRAGLVKPDISSSGAVKTAVLASKAIAYSSGPSGYAVAELFKKLGIADEVKDRIKQPASGVQISDLLARGEADMGFQQVSELHNRAGIQYLGPLPSEIQSSTTYAAGLHPNASETAKALVKLLTSPSAAPTIRSMGMEPG